MNRLDKKCFVLMPFSEELREIYTEVYKPTCEENKIHCWRVDEISSPGSITRDIVEGILDADIIIADLTNQNPNVFYELGIAHASGNKTIMTSKSLDYVPFDIANYRIILYEHTLNGCRQLKKDLDRAIKELLEALDRTNNPFQEVVSTRGYRFSKGKTPLAKLIDFSDLPNKILNYFTKNKIRYKEDLRNEHLEELMATPGIGRTMMSRLCTVLMQRDIFDDVDFLHDFVVKHRLDATGTRGYFI